MRERFGALFHLSINHLGEIVALKLTMGIDVYGSIQSLVSVS